jgi:hypothetical protein
MPDQILEFEGQIHFWPWSVGAPSVGARKETHPLEGNIKLPFYGSPIISLSLNADLILPSRTENFIPLGPKYPPARPEYRIFETPHGVLTGSTMSNPIQVRTPRGRFTIELLAQGARQRYKSPSKTEHEKQKTALAIAVLNWSQFFDDLLDEARKTTPQADRLSWRNILNFIDRTIDGISEPRMALIVKIAETMHRRLPLTIAGARKILLRERHLLPVARVVETDSHCLHWYIRQPGETMAEKAGARQLFLAVTRRESYDTLENRILKDFIHRCRQESQRYLNEVPPQLQASNRAKLIISYKNLCSYLARDQIFENVARPPHGTPPNYVLQNDYRYRDVWRWYCLLLRRQDEDDRFWDWQARTWADITRLLVNIAFVVLVPSSAKRRDGSDGIIYEEILKSSMQILKEQQLGCRMAAGTELGPLRVTKIQDGEVRGEAVLEIVHPLEADRHPIGRLLGRTGGHLYLVLNPLGAEVRRKKAIIVWGVHTAGAQNPPSWEIIARSAAQGLQRHADTLGERLRDFPELRGIAVADDLQATRPTKHASDGFPLIQSPAYSWFWVETVFELAETLNQIIGELL